MIVVKRLSLHENGTLADIEIEAGTSEELLQYIIDFNARVPVKNSVFTRAEIQKIAGESLMDALKNIDVK